MLPQLTRSRATCIQFLKFASPLINQRLYHQKQVNNSRRYLNNMVVSEVQPAVDSAVLSEKKRVLSESSQDSSKSVPNNNNKQHQQKGKKSKRKAKRATPEPTTPLGILLYKEIPEICKEHNLTEEQITNPVNQLLNDDSIRAKYNREVENVKVLRYSSNGEGLALIDHPDIENGKQIVTIPFSMPGDIVKIKVFTTKHIHVEADLLEIQTKGESRDDSLIKCKYFGVCSGCQYQQIDYDQQLEFKQNTVKNAYKYFAPRLSALNRLPEIGETVSSPLKYGYRSKLTPHYEINRFREATEVPNIGFGSKGRPKWRPEVPMKDYPGEVMDIEDCIIGTEIIRKGMKNERERLSHLIQSKDSNAKGLKHKAATVLLREDTKYLDKVNDTDYKLQGSKDFTTGEITTLEDKEANTVKTCVTDNNTTVSEIVGGLRFDFVANEFFQNNNSILPKIIKYVQDNLGIDTTKENEENYLVDAYCGSGLFGIASAKSVTKSLGVEISAHSIRFAKKNVELNNITNCSFIEGKAEKLFASIDFPRDKTSVILDPPRKGSDEIFLKQLSEFYPQRIVYISCNVHSQARDLEFFINETENGNQYEVESIRGFDFFPQTHHVEGVAVLKRKASATI